MTYKKLQEMIATSKPKVKNRAVRKFSLDVYWYYMNQKNSDGTIDPKRHLGIKNIEEFWRYCEHGQSIIRKIDQKLYQRITKHEHTGNIPTCVRPSCAVVGK